MVERLPGVQEVMGSTPDRVISKTLKMVLDASLLKPWHLKVRSRNMVVFPIVDCKMWPFGNLYLCPCKIAFKCGSTISATSRHQHNMTEIRLEVTVNWITHTHQHVCHKIKAMGTHSSAISLVNLLNPCFVNGFRLQKELQYGMFSLTSQSGNVIFTHVYVCMYGYGVKST